MLTIACVLYDIEKRFLAANLYYGHGTDNAWDEAVALVLYALGLPIDSDRSVEKKVVTAKAHRYILSLVKRRIVDRIPLPYITYQAWFAGLAFYVDKRVLIPRSPIAEFINQRFQPWIKPDQVNTIADIGTGSGCIAIACAKAFPGAKIDAIDIDTKALEVALVNVTKHDVLRQVRVMTSDLFSALGNQQYDIIVSNPPYVGHKEMAILPLEYYHEPKSALFSNQQGLMHVSRILKVAHRYLSSQGILIIEVGNSQKALEQRYPQVPFLWLACQYGGEGILLLTKEILNHYQF